MKTSGEKYEGEWENSLRHGKGVTTRGDTYKHNGKWRRGKMHGKGTLEDDGINYVGDFKSGQRTGKGHIQYNDLLEYKGDMLNGKRQGNGIMLFEDDRRYNGEWDNDEMQGYGVMSYPNGDEYNGPFERGMLDCVVVFESTPLRSDIHTTQASVTGRRVLWRCMSSILVMLDPKPALLVILATFMKTEWRAGA